MDVGKDPNIVLMHYRNTNMKCKGKLCSLAQL